MRRSKLLKLVLYLMIFMFLANSLAQKFYWYYSIWWFDIPMHFLGGFWQGIFFLWFFSLPGMSFLRISEADPAMRTARRTLVFVLAIGLGWELFEFLTNNYLGREPWILLDTFSDLFFDVAGGCAAFLYSIRSSMQSAPDTVKSK